MRKLRSNIYRCDIPTAFCTLFVHIVNSILRVATIVIFLHIQSRLLIHLKYAHIKIFRSSFNSYLYPFSCYIFNIADDICFESVMNLFICGGNSARHVFFLFKWQKTYSLKAINYLKIHGEIRSICVCMYFLSINFWARRKFSNRNNFFRIFLRTVEDTNFFLISHFLLIRSHVPFHI